MLLSFQFEWVFASIIVAIFGCFVALYLLAGIDRIDIHEKRLRIVSAALAFATGTWTMHFVGMLAVRLPIQLAYDPVLTLFSYLIAVLGAIPAMLLISQRHHLRQHFLIAAFYLTVTICAMHYSGMAALRMSPAIHYHGFWFALSIVIALVASSVGLLVVRRWQVSSDKSYRPLILSALLLGFAISAMHYSAMMGVQLHDASVSQAYLQNGIRGDNLVYAVMSASLLILLLVLFASLKHQSVVLWKVLFIVGLSETTIMLVLPLVLPNQTDSALGVMLDGGVLMLLVSPVAWRLKVTASSLQMSKFATEQNLEIQRATNQLLSLPINELSMDALLSRVLAIVEAISWLRLTPKGAIFLNESEQNVIRMAAQHDMDDEIRQRCAQVAHGQCLCGKAALKREIVCRSHVDCDHTTGYEGMQDHGHYIVPLLSNDTVLGVLCLYLEAGHQIAESEVTMLKTLSNTIAELIRFKLALEEIALAETVFEHNLSCLLITNADSKILKVNPTFTKVTGYSQEEVLGKTPAVLSSGRHDQQFYDELWRALKSKGHWEGEIWNRRKNGECYPEWLAITAVRDHQQQISHYVANFADITKHKEAEERIRQLAFYDPLTGLVNRTLFYDRLEQAIQQAQRCNGRVALLFVDLDHFKEVNDTLGHDAGDELLKEVAERIESCLRACDTLARLGGDEFVIILREPKEAPHHHSMEHVCQATAEAVLQRLSEAHRYANYSFSGGASIGIVIYPDMAESISDLLLCADTAMYQAKNAGRNTYRFFSSFMAESIKTRVTTSHALRHAIENQELYLCYQPLIDIDDQHIVGAEVLLRWRNPQLGEISPLEFIPLAEDSGLILSIGEWVMQQACRQMRIWRDSERVDLAYLAVNVSIHQLIVAGFAQQMAHICAQNGLQPADIELEITEGGLAQYPDNITDILHQLNAAGFKLAIDDFGTDYSSLSRLKAFNVDVLKIDRSFIREMTNSKDDAAIAKAIVDLARAMELVALAEGVETREQFELLKQFGCQRCQGYLFGKPMSADQFERLWRSQDADTVLP